MAEDQENRLYLTNNYSIVSKYSAVKSLYFEDPILEDFVENWLKPKSWRRAPIVNRGYAARLLAMDWAVDRILRCHNVGCAIVLGAGYDMLSLRRNQQTCWIEIDLPQVVQVKIDFIKDKFKLQPSDILQCNESSFSINSLNYHLLSCDICDKEALRKQLDSVLKLVNRRFDVAIINEVCLCYIEPSSVETIIETIIESVEDSAFRAHYIGYEQMKPTDGNEHFGQVMLSHFESLGHPIKHYPSSQDLLDLFKRKLSFQHVTLINMHNTFHNVLTDKISDLKGFSEEPFDEFEEMDLYLAHYKLVMGTLVIRDPFTGKALRSKTADESNLCEMTDRSLNLSQNIDFNFIKDAYQIENKQLQRFGHASCLLEPDLIFVTGGFGKSIGGKDQQQHRRVSDCLLLKFEDEDINTRDLDLISVGSVLMEKFPTSHISLNRMHPQVSTIKSKLFINGGRQSPKGPIGKIKSFVATIDPIDGLKLDHCFEDFQPAFRWRHKQAPVFGGCRIVQVGGLSSTARAADSSSTYMWDFSSDKLGYIPISRDGTGGISVFDRHTFGMDVSPSQTVVVIWGGLRTEEQADKPAECSKFLWDLRDQNTITDLSWLSLAQSCKATDNQINCYGANVHFINDNQILRIGGLNTENGLEFGWDKRVELFDLRNYKSVFVGTEMDSGFCSTLTNATSCKMDQNNAIVTVGGGGNYFTFGTCFQGSHLVYKYALE